MSRNTDPTKGCGGKHGFKSFTRAERSATRASRSNDEAFHAYKCVRCNRFHVGHSKPALVKPASAVPIEIEEDDA
jgi:hypothetical protein